MKTLFITLAMIASSSLFAQTTLINPILSDSQTASTNQWILSTPPPTAPSTSGNLYIAPSNQGAFDYSKQTTFFNNGSLGLGLVSAPVTNDKLIVAGNINTITGSDINPKIGFYLNETFPNPLNANPNDPSLTIANYGMTKSDNNTLSVSGWGGINFLTNQNAQMRVLNTGQVLIGRNKLPTNTAFANYKLYVQGGILATEIRVAVDSAWPDYVFSKNHQLTPLDEVEKYINENGHLSQIPSASTIKEEGISVSEMIRIQQEKIEELTLYIIEQNKRIKALESKSNNN